MPPWQGLERIGQFAAHHHRIALVGRRREVRRDATLRRLGDVFQPGTQAVDNRHVADRLVADVVEADREVHFIARLGQQPGSDLYQAQLSVCRRLANGVNRIAPRSYLTSAIARRRSRTTCTA